MGTDLGNQGKVLYVSRTDISIPDGPGVNEREFIIELCAAFGNRCHVIIPHPRFPLDDVDCTKISFSPSVHQRNVLSLLSHEIRQGLLVRSAARSQQYDLMIIRVPFLPIAAIVSTLLCRLPFALKTVSPGRLVAAREQGLKGSIARLAVRVHSLMLGWLAQRAIALDACTEQHIEAISKGLGVSRSKILLVDNATNVRRFTPVDKTESRRRTGLDGFDPIIGYVGGRPWERGGEQLIELAYRLRSRYPGLGVVVVGGGAGMSMLKERAKGMGVEDRCVFTGIVPYDKVPWFVNSFDIGIALDLDYKAEVSGNANQKIRQYLACGKPVIASEGGNSFLVDSCLGAVVRSTDVDAMESLMLMWLSRSDEEKREQSARAVAYARAYLSMSRTMEERVRFWNRCLSFHHDNASSQVTSGC